MEEKSCLKCGRPCGEGQAFCGECLAEMEKYPVKPGVVVLLPQRERIVKPPVRRRPPGPSPEEQVARLKKRVLTLWIVLILTLTAAGGLGWLAISEYLKNEEPQFLPGQNYSSEIVDSPEETH